MPGPHPRLSVHRRTLLAGLSALTVTPALSSCGSGSSAPSAPTAGTVLGPAIEVPVGGGKVYAQQL